ncbi:MAG: hypothetical protein ORN53_01410, partial [Crocinitomicaceae bacterium]|nr:hypothetical protein [Crocinitomicaceae bacterium]
DNYLNINSAVGYTLYANQAAAEGKFYWVTGPEKGTQISTANGTFISGVYNNYAGGEPNNYGSGEDITELFVSNGQWDDLPSTSTNRTVQEFGGMPTDNLSSTIVFSRNIYVNGAPTSGISGGGVSVCSGVNSTVLTLNGFTVTVVRWERSSDNFITTTNTVAIANTSTSYTVSNITQTTYYRAIVNTVGNTCTNLATSPVAVNVAAASPGNLNSLNSTICDNGYAEINLFGAN